MFDKRPVLRHGVAAMLAGAMVLGVEAAERVDVAAFEYPPIYQNEIDKGVAGDLAVAAFKAADVDAELQLAPEVRIGSVIHYVTQTFLYDRRRFPEGIRYSDLGQLAHFQIGVLNSSGIMKLLQKSPGLKLAPNTVHEGSAKQLYQGRIDLWAVVDLTGHLYLSRLFAAEADRFERTASFNRGDVSLICSRKRDPDGIYAQKFAEGLARIKKNGTYMQIMAKYYGGARRINPESLTDDMR